LGDYYWDLSHFPTDLTGKTVLDVGSNDGLNAFHCERIGAKTVLGIDIYRTDSEFRHTTGWSPVGCELAKKHLHSKVAFKSLNAYHVSSLDQKFDVVILADVMNWLSDLPQMLREVSSVCTGQLIIRDGLLRSKDKAPLLHYVHGPTEDLMFLPNAAFMRAVLKENGFREVTFHKIAVDRLFDDWASSYPLLTSEREVPVFIDPWEEKPIKTSHLRQNQALCKIGNRLFVRGAGWVDADGVVARRFLPGRFARAVRKSLGDSFVHWLRNLVKHPMGESYTIVATR
jgi:SAM-dependent methyltransferase